MADAAKFGSAKDLHKFYTDYYVPQGGPAVPAGQGLRPVGPTPARAFPVAPYQAPRVLDITPPVTAPQTPVNVLPRGTVAPNLPGSAGPPALRPAGGVVGVTERGFRVGAGSFSSARPIDLTDAVGLEHPPAVRPSTSPVGVTERGFTMGQGSSYVDTTARGIRPASVPKPPLQIGYGYTPPKGFVGPNIPAEGMGDFAPPQTGGVGKGLGLRSALRSVGRVAFGPEALAVQGLAIPAAAQARATANSNGPVLGLKRGQRIFGMTGGPRPGEAFSTNAISYTDPVTGNPVAVSQAPEQVVTDPTTPVAQRDVPIPQPTVTFDQPQATPTPAAPALTYGGNVGYVGLSGEKNTVLTDIGATGRPVPKDYNGLRNGVVPGQAANSRDLIDNIISGGREPAVAAATPAVSPAVDVAPVATPRGGLRGRLSDAYRNGDAAQLFTGDPSPAGAASGEPQYVPTIRFNPYGEANSANGGGYKTLDDYTGGLRSSSGEGAAFGLRFAAARAAQNNRNLDNQQEMEQKRQELGLKGQELGLKGQELGLTARKYQSEDIVNRAHADYYKGVEADRTSKAEKEAWLMSPEGQAFTLRSKGHEEDQEAEKSAQKAYTDAIARGGDPLAAENAYVASKGLRKGLRVVPGAPATPSKGALFWKKEAQPATSAVAAPPAAVVEYNAAMTAAGDDTKKKALIDARFRATYGGL